MASMSYRAQATYTPCQGTPYGPVFSSTWHKRPPHAQPQHSQSPHYGGCTKQPASPTRQATLRSNTYAKPCVASIVDQSTPNRHSALCSSRKLFHAWRVTTHPLADLQKATIFVLGFCGWKSASSKNCYKSHSSEDALSVSRPVLQHRLNLPRTMLFSSWLSSITLFDGPSFLGLLTICISPTEQCALVL